VTFASATFATTHLVAFILFLQAIELFLVTQSPAFKTVWAYSNVAHEIECGLPLPNSWVRALFAKRGFEILVLLQAITAVAAFFIPVGAFFAALTLGQLLICVRFRGSFNGGSDMMTFVLLGGVLILTFSTGENAQRFGLIYIAVQAIYSYVKSGLVKVKDSDWRSGKALSDFLSRSLFTDIKRIGVMVRFKQKLARALTWALLAFELGAFLMPFLHRALWWYFAAAVIFHFTIYRAFGLNRFFWAWISTWPAIFYLSTLT
jgi:hypothetical protein